MIRGLLLLVFLFFNLFSGIPARMEISVHPLLSSYQWQNRLLLIFSPKGEDQAFTLQVEELLAKQKELQERDLLLFYIYEDRVILPDETVLGSIDAQNLRQHYMMPEKETATLLIGKDGTEKLRSRDLLTTQRLFSTIDAMPMRQRESRN